MSDFFFTGKLQEGIARAVAQQKLVVCLVCQEDSEESQVWQNEWLQPSAADAEPTIGDRLAREAVSLKIIEGSVEATQLAAFCNVGSSPELIIISNGSVVTDIKSGIAHDEFVRQIQGALTVRHQSEVTPAHNAPSHNGSILPDTAVTDRDQGQQDHQIQSMLAERGARLESERQKMKRAEDEARKNAAREKLAAEAAGKPQDPTAKSRRDWVEEQAKRKKEARADKERVLQMIQADKQARREREEQRRLASTVEQTELARPSTKISADRSEGLDPASPMCAIQLRLFDGSSIRAKFETGATLSGTVRGYITSETSTNVPYSFRQIRTPLPSANIDVGEEAKSLQSLGLTPSATLVLVPVHGYTDAYPSVGPSGYLARGVTFGLNVITGTAGLLGSLIGRLIGYTGATQTTRPQAGPSDENGSSTAAASKKTDSSTIKSSGPSSVNIRTLHEQQNLPEQNEFYNGNQLSFEPRRDDDQDDKPS